MKKWLITPVFLISLAILTIVVPTYAADATESGSIQDKLKALETEIASKAATLKLEVDKKLQNKMFAGTVISKSDGQYIISPQVPDPDNPQNETILVNSFTTYDTSSKKLSQTISNGDFIIALGDVDDKGNLAAKKVIKSEAPDDPTVQSSTGKVTSIDGLNLTVQDKDNKLHQIETDWNTNFYSGSDEIALNKIDTDKFVVAIGTKDGDNLKARFVYLVPDEQATPLPSASESASLNATPKK